MEPTTVAPPPSDRTRIRRLPARGAYDRPVVDAILDEGLVCHLGFSLDGQPFVIPTIHGRLGDIVYVHGSAASRMLRHLRGGVPACLTVTLVDGLVLARSAFHHSMNYRSVVLLGAATLVESEEERMAGLEAIVDHVVPGRWPDVRQPNATELKATMVLRLPISEASAKIRTGGPVDDEPDFALPVWAGELPLRLAAAPLVPDARLAAGIAPPVCVTDYWRTRAAR